MTHPYADELIEAFQALAKTDFTKLTAVAFLGELRLNLINEGFTVSEAEKITVSLTHTELPVGSLTDQQVSDLALSVAQTLARISNAFRDMGFHNPFLGVIEMASKMTIRLS